MEIKPKIYAFCQSGCKWEVAHKSDVDNLISALPYLELIDTYTLEKDIKYLVKFKNEGYISIDGVLPIVQGTNLSIYEELVFDKKENSVQYCGYEYEVITNSTSSYTTTIVLDFIINGVNKKVEITEDTTKYPSAPRITITFEQQEVEELYIIHNTNSEIVVKPYEIFIRYADDENGTNMTEVYNSQAFMGIYVGMTASVHPKDYTWMKYWIESGDIVDAEHTNYDNTQSELKATNVQEAIDEVVVKVIDLENNGGSSVDVKRLEQEITDIKNALYGTILDVQNETYKNVGVAVMDRANNYPIVDNQKAQVMSIKGRTLNVNQLIKNGNFTTSDEWRITSTETTATFETNKLTIRTTRTGGSWTAIYQYINGLQLNNQYYLKIKYTKSSNCALRLRYPQILTISDNSEYIITATEVSEGSLFLQAQSTDGQEASLEITEIAFVDSTKAFGAGNEPTTIDEFNRLTMGFDFDTYNEGTVESTRVNKIISNPFNIFDGKIEGGNYHNDGGYKISATNNFRSSDYISVVGGKEYTIFTDIDYTNGQVNIYEYDKNKNFLGMQYSYNKPYATFALRDNTCYVNLSYYKGGSGWQANLPTNFQICFHLTGDGSMNGTYKPYKEPVEVEIEPVELNGIGSAQDERTENRTTRVIGVDDMETFSWQYAGGNIFYASLSNVKATDDYTKANILCSIYATVERSDLTNETICISGTDVIIQDASCHDIPSLLAKISGKPFYFEKATPTVEENGLGEVLVQVERGGTISSDSNADMTLTHVVYKPMEE